LSHIGDNGAIDNIVPRVGTTLSMMVLAKSCIHCIYQ